MPLRLKLQALLMLLDTQPGGVDAAFLKAKLYMLLKLPDVVLAQLMEHPDLADLNEILDSVLLGTSDLSAVMTELDKIEVTSVPGPSENIDVIHISGKPAYIVHSPGSQKATENAAAAPAAVPAPPPVEQAPPPSEPMTMSVQVEEGARVAAPATMMAPPDEQLNPPPPPAPPPPPTPELTNSLVKPTSTPQSSPEIFTSGNMFKPGETVSTPTVDNSPATQTQVPSTQPTAEAPAEPSEPPGGGADPAPGGNEGGGTPPAGEPTP
jgi:hypothetical protein